MQLPNDVRAECSVLGAILLRNESINLVDTLQAGDFFDPRNRSVFTAMRELEEKRVAIDPVTLEDRLLLNGFPDALSYINDLVGFSGSSDNISHYSKIVQDKAAIRRVMLTASTLVSMGYEADSPEEYLLQAEQNITNAVSGDNRKRETAPLRTILKQAMDAVGKRSDSSGGVTGVPSGFPLLDSFTGGWQPSDLIILGARPAMGKTALALNLAANAVLGHGIPTIVFSLEMSSHQLAERLMFSEARVDGQLARRGKLTRQDMSSLVNAGNKLSDSPLTIEDSSTLGPTEIRAKVRRWRNQNKHPLGLILVDYLQLMRVPGFKGSNREQEISEISRSLKHLAKEHSLPVVALSQLNRTLEARSDKRPLMSDLRESGAIEQDADLILFLYRDEVYSAENCKEPGVAELAIAKHRSGPTGMVKLRWHNQYTRFDSISSHYTGEEF
jgi:replicative DNA helicase